MDSVPTSTRLPQRTVAEAIAARLAGEGTRFVFGIPGGETLDLLDAFRREGLEFVLTRHEATASFAALAQGELTGRPGVCLATLGPGATNLLSGVAAATLERAPLLAFTAQLPQGRRETTVHQRLDLHALFGPVTKASLVLEPGDALRALGRGLRLAVAPPPGAVHFEVPSDVPGLPCRDELDFGAARTASAAEIAACRPRAAPEALEEAAAMIRAAERPVMLIGLGARTTGQPAVIALAVSAGMPVVVTPKAKGLMPEDHPLFSGVLEMLGTHYLARWLRTADLCVFVGFDPVELDMVWDLDVPGVSFDLLPDSDGCLRIDLGVWGDLEDALRGTARRCQGRVSTARLEAGAGRAAEARAELEARLSGQARPGLISPREAIEAVRRAASSPRALVAVDVGAHKMAVGQLWQARWPGCFLMSNGQSSMGYGLPAAMVAKLLDRERQVVAIIGDGGLGMYLGELETVARLELALPIVVFSDGELSLIAMGQERRGYPQWGVSFRAPDYPALARSLGGHGLMVRSGAELGAEVTQAFGRQGFTLLAVPVDNRLYRV